MKIAWTPLISLAVLLGARGQALVTLVNIPYRKQTYPLRNVVGNFRVDTFSVQFINNLALFSQLRSFINLHFVRQFRIRSKGYLEGDFRPEK